MLVDTNQRTADAVDLVIEISNTSLEIVNKFKYHGVLLNNTLSWKDHIEYIGNKISSRFSMLPIPHNGTSLAVSHWKLRIVLMVEYRSSRLNQNKPFSGPVSTLLSSLAEFYSFSLSGRLRAVGLIALTICHNSLYTIN